MWNSQDKFFACSLQRIPVGRTSTSGELSIPITLDAKGTGYTDIFKLAGPVQFGNGEGKSYAKVNYGDLSKIDPSTLAITPTGKDVTVGLAFPISLTIPDGNASVANTSTCLILQIGRAHV